MSGCVGTLGPRDEGTCPRAQLACGESWDVGSGPLASKACLPFSRRPQVSDAGARNHHSHWVPLCAAGTMPWAARSSPHLARTTRVMSSHDHRLHTGGQVKQLHSGAGIWTRSMWFSVGFPGGASGKEPACQCRRRKRRGFNPWVGKMPWRRKWQPTPGFLPGESPAQRSLAGYSP